MVQIKIVECNEGETESSIVFRLPENLTGPINLTLIAQRCIELLSTYLFTLLQRNPPGGVSLVNAQLFPAKQEHASKRPIMHSGDFKNKNYSLLIYQIFK